MQVANTREVSFAPTSLSQQSKEIIQSDIFKKLKLPVLSTISYDSDFSSMRVSRYEHSIHAATLAHQIPNAKLSEYETQVLELCLLLHDVAHMLGSHATDVILQGMTEAPKIEKYGFSGQDFHEYHAVHLVASSTEIAKIFNSNERLLANVLAVLSHDDLRSFAEKAEYYGFKDKPTLTDAQIKILHTLVDWLDRVSYLQLEYSAIDFKDEVKKDALGKLNRFLASVEVHGDTVAFRQRLRNPERAVMLKGEPDESMAVEVIRLREAIFNETVYSPLSSLYSEYVVHGVKPQVSYADIKTAVLSPNKVDYTKIFSPMAYQLLSKQMPGRLSKEFIPIITLDYHFLTPAGKTAFAHTIPGQYPLLISNICGNKPRSSYAEMVILDEVRELLAERKLYVTTSGKSSKTFEYYTVDDSNVVKYDYKTVNDDSATNKTISFSVPAATSLYVKDALTLKIEDLLKNRRWIRSDLDLSRILDPSIFTRRYDRTKFIK